MVGRTCSMSCAAPGVLTPSSVKGTHASASYHPCLRKHPMYTIREGPTSYLTAALRTQYLAIRTIRCWVRHHCLPTNRKHSTFPLDGTYDNITHPDTLCDTFFAMLPQEKRFDAAAYISTQSAPRRTTAITRKQTQHHPRHGNPASFRASVHQHTTASMHQCVTASLHLCISSSLLQRPLQASKALVRRFNRGPIPARSTSCALDVIRSTFTTNTSKCEFQIDTAPKKGTVPLFALAEARFYG